MARIIRVPGIINSIAAPTQEISISILPDDSVYVPPVSGTIPEDVETPEARWTMGDGTQLIGTEITHTYSVDPLTDNGAPWGIWFSGNVTDQKTLIPEQDIRKLQCDDCYASYVEVKDFPYLAEFSASNNLLNEINLSNNPRLIQLYLNDNLLPSIDLISQTFLVYANFNNNFITEIDLSKNVQLREIKVRSNELSEDIDLSPFWDLEILDIGNDAGRENGNVFYELDISNNPKLWSVSVDNTQLLKINTLDSTFLTTINLSGNRLEAFDLENAPNAIDIRVNDNNLSEKVVDKVLQDLVDNGLSDGIILISGNEAPTDYENVLTLVSRGWNVSVDWINGLEPGFVNIKTPVAGESQITIVSSPSGTYDWDMGDSTTYNDLDVVDHTYTTSGEVNGVTITDFNTGSYDEIIEMIYGSNIQLSEYTVTYFGNGNTSGTVPIDLNSPYDEGSTVTVLSAGDLAIGV